MPECRVCGDQKKASDFYPAQLRKCGTVGECSECTRRRVKDNRERRAEYYREYDAERYQKDPRVRQRHRKYQSTDRGKASMRRSRGRWLSENQDKRHAHVSLGNAVRSGKVVKPKSCENCGATGRIEGHHYDYSKPLDVKWLCRSCHVAIHREMEDA